MSDQSVLERAKDWVQREAIFVLLFEPWEL
jgi:hypothetical protein